MTLIKSKFDYSPINRKSEDGKRLYRCPDGNAVPSVTTILDKTKDKTHLIEWRKRVGEKKAQEITTEAAGVGTRMHTFLEKYIETAEWPSPGTNPFSQQAHKMADRIREEALEYIDEIWGSEVNLYFPQIYAGTTDLLGVYKGSEAIMDFKQTNKLKKREWIDDYFIQTVAYGTAHNEMFNTNIRKGVILMCSKDNEYQEFIIEGKEFDHYVTEWFKRLEQYYSKFV